MWVQRWRPGGAGDVSQMSLAWRFRLFAPWLRKSVFHEKCASKHEGRRLLKELPSMLTKELSSGGKRYKLWAAIQSHRNNDFGIGV